MMKMVDPHAYTISVRRKEIDGERVFEANVAELPDISGYGESYQEAYEFAVDMIEELAKDAEAERCEFPPPRADDDTDYSGRVTLRLTRKVHRLAAEAAEREGVSLNAYLSMAIAQEVAQAAITKSIVTVVQDAFMDIRQDRVSSGTSIRKCKFEAKPTQAASGVVGLRYVSAFEPSSDVMLFEDPRYEPDSAQSEDWMQVGMPIWQVVEQ